MNARHEGGGPATVTDISKASAYLRRTPTTIEDQAVLLERLQAATPAIREWLERVEAHIADHDPAKGCPCGISNSFHLAVKASRALTGGGS